MFVKMKKFLFCIVSFTALSFFLSCGKQEEENEQQLISISGKFTKTLVAGAMTYNKSSHEKESDYVWDASDEIPVELNVDEIIENSDNCSTSGSVLTIYSPGTYRISGSLTDGRIIVNSPDDGVVRLIFAGVNINCQTGSPVYIADADKVVIILEESSQNYLSDTENYVYDVPESEEPNATIFSKSDLTISGSGSLNIDANFNDAVSCKDGLIVKDAVFDISSVDDGLRGKDYLIIDNPDLTITATGDALKSDNDEDAKRGYVFIKGGKLNLTSGCDAIQAVTDALVSAGEIQITAGGGSGHTVSGTKSSKGIKSGVMTIVDGGTISINSADDALHSNDYLCVNGGTFSISSADDGIHSDSVAGITGGTIVILKSYEGIESAQITISGGDINLTASDDGINVAGGNDGSGFGGNPPGQTSSTASDEYFFYMHGGYVVVKAAGDGVDVNGSVYMDEGYLIVHGPTENMNGPLDYDATFTITGGTLIAAGSSGMAQAPDESSTQYSIMLKFNSVHQGGTIVDIQTKDGDEVICFEPLKNYQSFVFSSPQLVKGLDLVAYCNGSSTGVNTDGVYSGGTYSGGSQFSSFKIRSITQIVQ